MAEEKLKNPFMEMYSIWEKMMTESLDAMLRNPTFVTSMAKVFESSLVFKEQIDKSIQATLHAMNLPSTKDIADIYDALGSLRIEVDELKRKMDLLLQKVSQEGTMNLRELERRKS